MARYLALGECSACHETRKIFNVSRFICRRCYNRRIAPARRAQRRAYYQRNRKAVQAKSRAYYYANRTAIRAQQRQYWQRRRRAHVSKLGPVKSFKGWGFAA